MEDPSLNIQAVLERQTCKARSLRLPLVCIEGSDLRVNSDCLHVFHTKEARVNAGTASSLFYYPTNFLKK